MKTAEINAALANILHDFTISAEKYGFVYATESGSVRLTFSEKAGEYRVANAVDNSGGYRHYRPENVAGAIARRLTAN
jgi:hypothetical protein